MQTKIRFVLFVMAIGSVLFLGPVSQYGQRQEKKLGCDYPECNHYTSDKCLCDKHSGDCEFCGARCTGGEDCSCLKELKEKNGSLTGTVKNKTVKKFSTLVYIEEMPGEFKPSKKNAFMDQKGMEYIPHLLPVLVGTTVDCQNSDDFDHTTYSPDNETFNLGNFGKGEKRSYTFKRTGFYTILCSLHIQMIAYVASVNNPYFVIADKDGNFRISIVPPGKWKLRIWNERLKEKVLAKTFDVTIEAGKETNITIEP